MSVRYVSRSNVIGNNSPKFLRAPAWCARNELAFLSFHGYITATASATTHTKGAWAQVVASTAGIVSAIYFAPGGVAAASTNTSTLLDIGIGAAGSETVIAPNIAIGGSSNGASGVFVPVRVPASTRIAFRIQSAVSSKSGNAGWWLLSDANSNSLPTSLDSIGTSTATSAGTAMSGASGSWVEVAASAAKDYQCLVAVPSASSTAGNNGVWRLEVGIGASGSEVPVGFVLAEQTTGPLVQATGSLFPRLGVIGRFVPAGSRIAVRHNITSNPERLSVCLIGVPYP